MADCLLLLTAASLLRKRKRKADLISRFGNIDGLPRLLVDSLTKEIEMKGIYSRMTDEYNDMQMRIVQQYIPLVPPEALGHYDISVITSVSAFTSLCGLTFDEFGRYLSSMTNVLKVSFPKAPRAIICTKSYSLLLKTHETVSISIPI
jgi:hypothetical protein